MYVGLKNCYRRRSNCRTSVFSRCKHRQCQRPRILEYPVSALNQFGARVRRKDAVSRMLSSGNPLKSQIHVARPPDHICRSLSRRISSERCTPIYLSNSQANRLPCRHSIIRIKLWIPTRIFLKSSPLREV